MSNDYIRRQDVMDLWNKHRPTIAVDAIEYGMQLKRLPSADVVQVVRCKDCKFRENDDFCTGRGFPYQLVPDDGFCDKGEREG